MTTEIRDAAVAYARYGWHVLPLHTPLEAGGCSCKAAAECGSPGKHPRLRFTDASDNPDRVSAWWDQWPDANVGILTEPSGLVAIDVDNRESLEQLQADGHSVGDTSMTRTGRGAHLLYRWPDGVDLRNSASKLADGIDIRAAGGLVVMPPSAHASGRHYEWVRKTPPAELPTWVLDALASDNDEAPPAPEPNGSATTTPYGRAVLDQEVSRLLDAPEGQRNHTLFAVAVRIFELVKADQIDQILARDRLLRAAVGIGLQRQESIDTLESAWERAEARPPEQPSTEEPRVDLASHQSRLMSIDDLENIDPPRWLVPQILPEGMTVLYGPPGSGKTFVALDAALTLASHGEHVVYAAGEGASGLSLRVRAWCQANPGHDPSGYFHVLTLGAFPRLLDSYSADLLRADLAQMPEKPTLLVVDTWSRALVGASDSDDGAVRSAIAYLDDIRHAFGTSVLVVHHPKKESQDNQNPAERGSGALRGESDCVWKCHATDNGGRLFNDKIKEWDTLPSMSFRLRPVAGSCVVSPSVVDLMRGQ